MKNILIFNSNYDLSPLLDLLLGVLEFDYSLKIYSSHGLLAKKVEEKQILVKNFPNFSRQFGAIKTFLFFILFPLHFFLILFWLTYKKLKKQADVLICFNWPEKIIFCLPAKILKIKNIWFDLPPVSYNLNIFLSSYLHLCCRRVAIITLRRSDQQKIKNTKLKSRLEFIPLAINTKKLTRQDNIFNSLAKSERREASKKFFSIGTIIDLNSKQKLETIFQSIKKCLTVVPNIQLIVIGDGRERKSLSWLAKKMNIDNLTWFVGEQKYLYKWLENLDVYVIACNNIELSDIEHALLASSASIPVITARSHSLDDYYEDNKNCALIDFADMEAITQTIIKLKQNKQTRSKTARAGLEVLKQNSLANSIEQLIKILNS